MSGERRDSEVSWVDALNFSGRGGWRIVGLEQPGTHDWYPQPLRRKALNVRRVRCRAASQPSRVRTIVSKHLLIERVYRQPGTRDLGYLCKTASTTRRVMALGEGELVSRSGTLSRFSIKGASPAGLQQRSTSDHQRALPVSLFAPRNMPPCNIASICAISALPSPTDTVLPFFHTLPLLCTRTL